MTPDASRPPQSPGPTLPQLLTLRILWGALLLSVVIHVGIAFVVAPQMNSEKPGNLGMLELILAAVGLVNLGASYVVPKLIAAQALKGDSPESLTLDKLVPRLVSPWIVRLALCESVTILGFVVALLSHQPMKIVPFAALSLLAMLMYYPSESALRSLAQR